MYMPKTLKEAINYYADEQVCIDKELTGKVSD